MDPAVCLPVISKKEERAVPQCPAIRLCPIVNAGNAWQIIYRNIAAVALFFVGQGY